MKETEENNQKEILETGFDNRKTNFKDRELDEMNYDLVIIYDKRTFYNIIGLY